MLLCFWRRWSWHWRLRRYSRWRRTASASRSARIEAPPGFSASSRSPSRRRSAAVSESNRHPVEAVVRLLPTDAADKIRSENSRRRRETDYIDNQLARIDERAGVRQRRQRPQACIRESLRPRYRVARIVSHPAVRKDRSPLQDRDDRSAIDIRKRNSQVPVARDRAGEFRHEGLQHADIRNIYVLPLFQERGAIGQLLMRLVGDAGPAEARAAGRAFDRIGCLNLVHLIRGELGCVD